MNFILILCENQCASQFSVPGLFFLKKKKHGLNMFRWCEMNINEDMTNKSLHGFEPISFALALQCFTVHWDQANLSSPSYSVKRMHEE